MCWIKYVAFVLHGNLFEPDLCMATKYPCISPTGTKVPIRSPTSSFIYYVTKPVSQYHHLTPVTLG